MILARFKKTMNSFSFADVVSKDNLPAYARQYVKKETILTIYKTARDYGIFTDKKIVLFDNNSNSKQIHTIPYKAISTISVIFYDDSAELQFIMNFNEGISLKFINMSGDDKLRLRILYHCIDKIISGLDPTEDDMSRLIENKISLQI